MAPRSARRARNRGRRADGRPRLPAAQRDRPSCGAAGARLIDLTQRSKLSRPTVHRILQSLSAAQLRAPGPRRPGATGSAWRCTGWRWRRRARSSSWPSCGRCSDGLAQRTGETAYLMLRQGDEVLCIARVEGAAPIRTLLIEVGAHRPIGADHRRHRHAGGARRRGGGGHPQAHRRRHGAATAMPRRSTCAARSPTSGATVSASARTC